MTDPRQTSPTIRELSAKAGARSFSVRTDYGPHVHLTVFFGAGGGMWWSCTCRPLKVSPKCGHLTAVKNFMRH